MQGRQNVTGVWNNPAACASKHRGSNYQAEGNTHPKVCAPRLNRDAHTDTLLSAEFFAWSVIHFKQFFPE
ncbi:MAG: hypothetical protein M3Y57_19770, partial [Acidobacteriota bacterium]|nr:hypothetical protein [Acidobacteriota bacterium]